jgi:hypothetical protein
MAVSELKDLNSSNASVVLTDSLRTFDAILRPVPVTWSKETAMTTPAGDAGAHYLIPPRTLYGSTEEMLAQIDEAVQGLLALRHLIAVQHATRAVVDATPVRVALRLVPSDLQSESVNR